MTTIYPVGEVPYVALQAGGRRQRLARLGVAQRAAAFTIDGGRQNLASNNTLAATYAQGGGVTATGGQHGGGSGILDIVSVRETTANSEHWARWTMDSGVVLGVVLCASVYVKAQGRTRGRIGVSSAADFSANVAQVEFDLAAQTTTVVQAGLAQNVTAMGMEEAGDGYWRVWIAVETGAAGGVTAARVLLMNGASTSYAGSTSAGMDMFGGQIEISPAPSVMARTGQRPRMDDAIPQNWFLDTLTNPVNVAAGWTTTNATAAALTTATAPDGSFTALDVTETTANAEHNLTSSATAVSLSGVVTFSVYARIRGALSNRSLVLEIQSTSNGQAVSARFTFPEPATGQPMCDGTATASGGAVAVNSSIERVDADWVRCIVTAAGATAAWNQCRIRLATAFGLTFSYAGGVTEGFHLWGAELVSGYEPTRAFVQAPIPDAMLRDTGFRCRFRAVGSAATYADLVAIGGASHYWEVTVVGMGADNPRIGISRATSAMDGQNLGQTANTWGLLPNGNVQSFAGTVGTGPTYAQGDTLGFLLAWNAGTSRYALHIVKNPAGPFALPAASVSTLLSQLVPAVAREGSTSETVLDVNFGQRPFKGTPPPGFVPLAIDQADFPHSYSSASLPVEDATNYRASIMGKALIPALGRLASRPVFRRAVSCWTWGREQRREPVSAITLDNSDGALDTLAEYSNRDRVLALHLIRAAPFVTVSSGSRVATALVDQVSQDGGQVTITARDLLELLTVPVQNLTYPTTVANTAVHGKPRPIVLGNVRWAPVVMRSGPLLDFDIHEAAGGFVAIDEVRQAGALLANPADWAINGEGFRRATAVQGKQCARVRGAFTTGPVLIERLPALLTWIGVTKTARLTAGQLDTAGTIAALDTAAPYTLARYIGPDENLMASDLVREIMDSFTGDLYTGADGVLRAWRLVAPAGAPAFTWTEGDLLGEVERRPDQARGLTTTLGFARNYCVHSTGELAGAIQNTTLASELSQPFQSRTAAVGVAPAYRQAQAAAPFVTLLTDGAQAQLEADRVAAIYAVERAFYTVQVMVDSATALAVNPGALVSLTAPTADLRLGKLLSVVAVEGELASNSLTVTLWG